MVGMYISAYWNLATIILSFAIYVPLKQMARQRIILTVTT